VTPYITRHNHLQITIQELTMETAQSANMPRAKYIQSLAEEVEKLKKEGLYKAERIITSPQQAIIRLEDGSEVINLCANNYLGLADHPDLIRAAKTALDEYGFGMSSVRFIC